MIVSLSSEIFWFRRVRRTVATMLDQKTGMLGWSDDEVRYLGEVEHNIDLKIWRVINIFVSVFF